MSPQELRLLYVGVECLSGYIVCAGIAILRVNIIDQARPGERKMTADTISAGTLFVPSFRPRGPCFRFFHSNLE